MRKTHEAKFTFWQFQTISLKMKNELVKLEQISSVLIWRNSILLEAAKFGAFKFRATKFVPIKFWRSSKLGAKRAKMLVNLDICAKIYFFSFLMTKHKDWRQIYSINLLRTLVCVCVCTQWICVHGRVCICYL